MMNNNKHSGFRRLLVVCVALLTCVVFAGCGDDSDEQEQVEWNDSFNGVYIGTLKGEMLYSNCMERDDVSSKTQEDIVSQEESVKECFFHFVCVDLDRKGYKDGDVVRFRVLRTKKYNYPPNTAVTADFVRCYAVVEILGEAK